MEPSEIVHVTSDSLQSKAKEIFNDLLTEINSTKKEASPNIEIEDLKLILGALGKQAKISDHTNSLFKNNDIIHKALKGENKVSDYKQESFVDIVSGKNIHDIIFNKNLEEKKDYIEEMTDLFYMMGGTKEGIRKDKLRENLKMFFAMNESPTDYLNGNFTASTEINERAKHEAEEICELLGSKKDIITVEDFIHVMTSDAGIEELFPEDLKINDY